MPHISKQIINEKTEKQLEERMLSLLNNTSAATRRKVFSELLTKTERVMIAKRLTLIFLTSRGVPTHTISDVLKMSPSTVARYEEHVRKGRWRATALWLRRNEVENVFTKAVGDLFDIFFGDNGQPMRLNKYLKTRV